MDDKITGKIGIHSEAIGKILANKEASSKHFSKQALREMSERD